MEGWMFLIVFCGFLMENAAGAALKCDDDNKCLTSNYCYLKTKTCTPCVQCGVYRRHKSVGCAKEPLQCGDCLPGFESEVLTNGKTRELCVPTPSTAAAPRIMEASASWTPYVAAVGISVFVVVVVIFLRWSSKLLIRIKCRTRYLPGNDSRSASSSYLYAPSAPPHSSTDIEVKDEADKILSSYISEEKESERYQCASKFLNPQYVAQWSPNNVPAAVQGLTGDQQDVVDGPANDEQPAFLIEENTLPSEWSPGPEYESALPTGGTAPTPGSLPLVTSFEGVLRLNAASAGTSGSQHSESANHSASDDSHPHGPQLFNVTNITVINNTSANCSAGVFNVTGR